MKKKQMIWSPGGWMDFKKGEVLMKKAKCRAGNSNIV